LNVALAKHLRILDEFKAYLSSAPAINESVLVLG